eukprot:TRINITY_DN9864_c0_g1_i1.p1 TRINITY_DN9864_c0_g1~~TRINITY_DN9864_c0_g1_i1.p1  ORF type:complete len:693 (+),score=127.25 TRINITY_DN9864_c0_g1_i1:98-2176(+)
MAPIGAIGAPAPPQNRWNPAESARAAPLPPHHASVGPDRRKGQRKGAAQSRHGRSRSRSRGKGKGGSSRAAISSGNDNFHHKGLRDDTDLNHGRLLRLLKLVQRNQCMTPPKEVYHRWNDFCDRFARPDEKGGGRPVRDPKLLSKELIKRFMSKELPLGFWTSLVKKIQAKKELGFSEEWAEFCDRHAPRMPTDPSKGIRDPRNLEPEFLLSFIACSLERDDRMGGHIAEIIDAYTFHFTDGSVLPQAQTSSGHASRETFVQPTPPPAKQPIGAIGAPLAGPATTSNAIPCGGNGSQPPQAHSSIPPRDSRQRQRSPRQRSPRSPRRSNGQTLQNLSQGVLLRLLKLIQRNQGSTPPKEVYNRWNNFCDANAPSHDGARATRDPKALPGGFIMRFLEEELPRNFWVFLVKKIQAAGKAAGLADAWTNFCDDNAPPLSGAGNASRATRDPRHLDTDFLVAFIALQLDIDDPQTAMLASIVDAYQFDFTLPGSQDADRSVHRASGSERPTFGRGGWGKGGRDSGGGTGRAPPPVASSRTRKKASEDDGGSAGANKGPNKEAANFVGILRLLQQESNAARRLWEGHCDENGRRSHAGDPAAVRAFLLEAVPSYAWADAVQHALAKAPHLREVWDTIAEEAQETGGDAWEDSEALTHFLCASLRRLSSSGVAGEVIGAAARSLEDVIDVNDAEPKS